MPENSNFNIPFVQIIEKHPAVYNAYLPEHSNRAAIDKAWHEIASTVHYPVETCKLRWKNIRNSFLRHLRMQSSSESGSSAKKKPYYLQEYLRFLIPFTNPRKKSNNLDQENAEESSEIVSSQPFTNENESHISIVDCRTEISIDAGYNDSLSESLPENETVLLIPKEEVDKSYFESTLDSSSRCSISPMHKKKKESSGNSIEDIARNYFNRKAKEVNDDGGLWYFFKSLIPETRHLSAKKKRILKMKILALIHELADEND